MRHVLYNRKIKLHIINVFCFLLLSLEQANNLREVQAMKKLNPHPNIIQLHELIL